MKQVDPWPVLRPPPPVPHLPFSECSTDTPARGASLQTGKGWQCQAKLPNQATERGVPEPGYYSCLHPSMLTGAKGQLPVIPALGRLRQEDCNFEPSWGQIARLSKQKQRYVEFGELLRDVAPGGNAHTPMLPTVLEHGGQHSKAGVSMSMAEKAEDDHGGPSSVVLECSLRPVVAVSQIL